VQNSISGLPESAKTIPGLPDSEKVQKNPGLQDLKKNQLQGCQIVQDSLPGLPDVQNTLSGLPDIAKFNSRVAKKCKNYFCVAIQCNIQFQGCPIVQNSI